MNTFSIRSEATSLLFYLLLFCKDRSVAAKFGVDDELSQQRRRRAIINGRVVADPSDAQFFAKTGGDNNKATPDYLCGATFVHNDILLTAAHCQGSFNHGVFLYDPDTNDYTREATVDLQIRYPGFNGVDKHDDILLLRLSADPGLPIVKMNSDDSTPTNNDKMRAYGFGKTSPNGSPSKKLIEGSFSYIDNGECLKRISSTTSPMIWDDVLCADPHYDSRFGSIDEGSSICQGDSGGPLLDSSNTLVGVVSWNYLCSSDQLPDGFARVSYFHDWITEQICFVSRKPLASNNECPFGTSPPPPVSGSVQVLLTFDHDFYPEETFFRVISKDRTDQVEYAGPKYVPGRESVWTSKIFLLPGAYTLEIFDMGGNGLSPGASGSDKKGSWALTAWYEDVEMELASGGANFLYKDVTDFVVKTIETESPMERTETNNIEPSNVEVVVDIIETQSPVVMTETSDVDVVVDTIETQSPVAMTETINIEPTNLNVVVDTIETQSPVAMTDTINIEPTNLDVVVDTIETQSPVVVMETINKKPSVECLSKKFVEELSFGTSSGTVCECLLYDSSMWELNCFDEETNDECATDRAACGDIPSLQCCGDRQCSNGICRRSVSHGRNDRRQHLLTSEGDNRRKSLVASGKNGSLRTIRGAGGSNSNIP